MLNTITSLVVAASDIAFGIVQYNMDTRQNEASTTQKQSELRLQQLEALNKLIPFLTAEDPDTRRYATSVLLSLYSTSDPEGLQVLDDNISKVANAETLEVLGIMGNRDDLKKRAAELFAIRAEHNRHEMAKADTPGNIDTVRTYQNAARADAERALSLDPYNAKAIYQRAVLLLEQEKATSEAETEFRQVINLMDQGKYRKDKEIYLRSHLRLMYILFNYKKKITNDVCNAFKNTKDKYDEMDWDYKQEAEMVTMEKLCKKHGLL